MNAVKGIHTRMCNVDYGIPALGEVNYKEIKNKRHLFIAQTLFLNGTKFDLIVFEQFTIFLISAFSNSGTICKSEH